LTFEIGNSILSLFFDIRDDWKIFPPQIHGVEVVPIKSGQRSEYFLTVVKKWALLIASIRGKTNHARYQRQILFSIVILAYPESAFPFLSFPR